MVNKALKYIGKKNTELKNWSSVLKFWVHGPLESYAEGKILETINGSGTKQLTEKPRSSNQFFTLYWEQRAGSKCYNGDCSNIFQRPKCKTC